MRRHVIVGRFGAGDTAAIPTAADEVQSTLNLVAAEDRLGHGIADAVASLDSLGVIPSEVGLDLLVLAAHVHAADTRISRESESQDTWTREIRVLVPVSDPARWGAAVPILRRALNFLTGDRWTIGFRARPGNFRTIMRIRPAGFQQELFDGVSLFSGGLDSLIGAIDALEAGAAPLLVSHAGEGVVSKAQVLCFDGLKAHYAQSVFNRLRVWMAFDGGLVENAEAETTTRARSFLFLAIGVFAGSGLGRAFTLNVPENGLIALNVPLDRLRLGALSTRTTHPFYMARWNELLTCLGIPGRVSNPYWSKTKGEMAEGCANRELLRRLLSDSLSCSSPTKGRWQRHGPGHCGYCLPCIIRRAALRGSDPTAYAIADLGAQKLGSTRADGQQVRSLQLAISRLQARPELAKLLIHIPGPLTDEADHLDALADVYRRGLDEVDRVLAGVSAGPV